LVFSPSKDPGSPYAFMAAGPFSAGEEQRARDLDVPFSNPEEALSAFSVNWVPKERSLTAGNPAFEVAWSNFDKALPYQPSKVHDIDLDASNGGTALIFDMGGKKLGRFFIDYQAPEGTTIDVAFTEDMHRGRPWILKRFGIYTAARTIAPGGKARFETFKPYGLRYLQVNIKSPGGPVHIAKTGVVNQVYPFQKTGSFTCSDPMMNRIWELGWRTLRVCAEDSYTDTPFRERGLYAGDALPEYAITLATSGDSRLIKRSVGMFADMYRDLMTPGAEKVKDNVNAMGDFPLITLQFYAWAFSRTGDTDFAKEYYNGYKNMVETYLTSRTDNGLFKTKGAFIEWTQIDRQATLTTMQSLIIRSMKTMAWVAGKLGKTEDQTYFNQEADKSTKTMRKLCWDNQKEAFRDGFKNGKPIDHYYPISSAWPVLFNQTTAGEDSLLKKHFVNTLTDIGDVDRKRQITRYGSFYGLGALYSLGMEDLAESFIRKYWSPMILKYDDTAWENFGDGSEDEGQGTLSHAWSGSPTYYLSTRVLGVHLGYPDFTDPDSVIIAPQTSTITWARGAVPHPKGVIRVDWQLRGDILFLDYKAPAGVKVDVKPAGMLAEKKLELNTRDIFN
ncbi:MAG TPA: alpha-L-rhamnosidase C-terminal domain-containing protein, partial [Bacteroidales bacterium]|nr:alpha-L-rhamnosidase C-terminal domain-containing protein [Bacteroidales bacterium]